MKSLIEELNQDIDLEKIIKRKRNRLKIEEVTSIEDILPNRKLKEYKGKLIKFYN